MTLVVDRAVTPQHKQNKIYYGYSLEMPRRGDSNEYSQHMVIKSFLRPFSPYLSFKKGSCKLLVKGCALSLPRKSVVRLTDSLDMTLVMDWNVKQQNKLLLSPTPLLDWLHAK